MPTPMNAFALAAHQFGDVDPSDKNAVAQWFYAFEQLPNTTKADVLRFLLEQDPSGVVSTPVAVLPTTAAAPEPTPAPPIPPPSPARDKVRIMNAKQRLPDLIKIIARQRATTPELLAEQIDQVSKSIGDDLFAALDKVNVDVLQRGLTISAVVESLRIHCPRLPAGQMDFVIYVYNYLFHGGALR